MTTEPEPAGRPDSTSLFVGAVVAVVTIAIGIGLVFVASSGASRDSSAGDVAAGTSEPSTTTSRSAASSTTTTRSSAGSGGSGTTTTTAPSLGSGSGSGSGTPAPPGRAVADPEDDPYEPVPLPTGISATLDSCNWSSDNGGELQATGTITASPETDDLWFVDVYWLQNNRELDSQTDVLEVAPGETLPWRLTIGAPLPPLDLRCALEIS